MVTSFPCSSADVNERETSRGMYVSSAVVVVIVIVLAMTSVLAIVSLSFSVAHHLCRHSSRLFVSCSVFEKECYLRYHSFSCSLSLFVCA